MLLLCPKIINFITFKMSVLWLRKIASSQYFNSIRNQIRPFSEQSSILKDTHGRTHTYLRISLTERCNLRCTYCMPEEGVPLSPNDSLLRTDEIINLVKLFVKNGVNKVRFTGGEPLVRKDCVELIKEIGKLDGLQKIGLTTNGIVLARKIADLKNAGLNQLNISLDTLQEKKFLFITKRNGFNKVMNSIEAALDTGFSPLKVFIDTIVQTRKFICL
jgi:molybdenum cofactor biosynthesis enzyme MoaA